VSKDFMFYISVIGGSNSDLVWPILQL